VFYTVYRTTNLVNGKYYFGVHKTNNPDDDYLGSGTYIKNAVAKYGADKFCKEVLFIFNETNVASAFAKEDELIQCYRGRDPLCMNLRKGGSGGFDFINRTYWTPEARERMREFQRTRPRIYSKEGHAALRKSLSERPKRVGWHHTEERRKRIAETNRATKALNPPKGWNKGLHLSKETCRLISEFAKTRTGEKNPNFGNRGEKNPRFGKRTVFHPVTREVRTIDKIQLQSFLTDGWKRGRKENRSNYRD